MSLPMKVNHMCGNSLPFLNESGSRLKVPAARRTDISPTSSSVTRTCPIQGRSSTIASSIQPIVMSSLLRPGLCTKKKGPQKRALP